MKDLTKAFSRSVLAAACLLTSSTLFAQSGNYEITVTNLTRGQTLTPVLALSHLAGIRLFQPGQPAVSQLAAVAEGGDTAPATALFDEFPDVVIDYAVSDGPVPPGGSVTLTISADGAPSVSVTSMLIPTNDTFFALNGATVPEGGLVFRSPGYDAGSEPNDELCANIPGPVCGGEGTSANAGGEGFVHINNGIHGIGDLNPAERDWRNPVAEIVVRRVP